jgi:PAS domain S-box-containing protein
MDIPDFHRRFLDRSPDGMLYCDRDGVIRYWNRGCQRIFGFSAEDAIGQSLDLIIPQSLRGRHWTGYAQTMATGHSRYAAGDMLAVPALHKDGTRISVEFSITPFLDDAGHMIGMGATMRDVTKRFEEMKALRKAAATANQASTR